MSSRGAPADASDAASGILVPIRSTHASEGRHEIDASGVGYRGGQCLDLAGGADDAQPVAQPLYHASAHEDAALEGIRHAPAKAQGDGGKQIVGRGDGFLATVHQEEAARAVGILHTARLGAELAEEGCLLVARNAPDGHRLTEERGLSMAIHLAARPHLGHQRPWDVEEAQQFLVPLQGVNIKQHRARGVGGIGDVQSAARELPYEPRVHRAEAQPSLLSPLAGAGHMVEHPFYLRSAEVGVDNQPRLLANGLREPVGLQPVAILGRAAVLPHDGIIDGFARLGIPQDGGLALIGDADGSDVLPADAHARHHLADDGSLGRPYLLRVVLHPARLGKMLCELLLRHGQALALAVEDDGSRTAGTLVDSQDVLLFHRLLD